MFSYYNYRKKKYNIIKTKQFLIIYKKTTKFAPAKIGKANP